MDRAVGDAEALAGHSLEVAEFAGVVVHATVVEARGRRQRSKAEVESRGRGLRTSPLAGLGSCCHGDNNHG